MSDEERHLKSVQAPKTVATPEQVAEDREPTNDEERLALIQGSMQERINELMQIYQKAGIHPSVINHDIFILDVKVTATMNVLMENGIFTDPQWTYQFKKALIEKLEYFKDEAENLGRQIRLASGIEEVPKIVDPRGNTLLQ